MKKNSIKTLIVIIIVIFVLGIVKDQVVKAAVTIVATKITGAPVHIDGFSLGILTRSVKIKGLKMYNPEGFSKGILVDLPKINVSYDLGSLLRKKIHLANVDINLKELGIEKNKDGKLNVDELKVAKDGEKQKGEASEQMPMQIDVLKLKIGRIVLKDYSAGGEPTVKVYDLNTDKGYKNITSGQQLAALILAESMKSAGIQGAKIYGVAMLAGAAVLPVGIAATFAGKDSIQKDFATGFDKMYDTALAVLNQMGRVAKEDRPGGELSANINGAQVYVKIRREGNKTGVTISARKYLFPKPEIASGVLYNISEKLK
ncbi:MAG: hypothetical protein WC312_06725 [Candidatus Omnitrophota bacterium]|jgi:uncharacterized protein involved in outer membrane biogenesis